MQGMFLSTVIEKTNSSLNRFAYMEFLSIYKHIFDIPHILLEEKGG